MYTTKQGYDMLTTKQAIQAIKKHKGTVVVNSSIGMFGLWVAVAKSELIYQLNSQYGNIQDEWLDIRVEDGDLYVEWVE